MKEWVEEYTHFWKNKIYVIMLALTAACSYGFMITNYAIGIDDTPYAYYFEDGLAAIVGRWFLFLTNKVLAIAEFAPYLTDLVGVLILMAAVTVWGTLFKRLMGSSVPEYGYAFFACIFISCPLISEVYVYYLHNGIAIGYLCSGISLCLFCQGLERLTVTKRAALFGGSAALLWIALGCYESFMMVWLMGVCLILACRRSRGRRDGIFRPMGLAGGLVVCSMLLRSVTIRLVTLLFHLEYLQEDAVQRSVTELAGWIFEPDAFSNFAMALKRTYVMYVVFGVTYYPIKIFVLATLILLLVALWYSIRRRDAWILLLTVAGYVAAFALVLVEGKAMYYRTAQFLPIVCGLGALTAVYVAGCIAGVLMRGETEDRRGCRRRLAQGVKGLVVLLLTAVCWNQCADMNKWFYVDYLKYEAAKETMYQVVYELEKGFDTSKPVLFTGIYEIPESITRPAYVGYGTEEYFKLLKYTAWLDEHLLEKFYRDQGVLTAQQPTLSVIEWGRTAFGSDKELTTFFEMHGYTLQPLMGADYEEAEQFSMDLPSFPRQGSIVDRGDYLIVHF